MNSNTTIAVDLAKSVFEIAVSNSPGSVSERHRISRSRFEKFFTKRQPTTVVLEACSSAHHWARQLHQLGHSVILLPPHAVRPYVVRNKTDRADAKGILEAFRNKDIRPVPVKSPDQHALAALHRFRSEYLAHRTARINSTRGILRELGITIPTGAQHVVPTLRVLLANPDGPIPGALRLTLSEVADEISQLQARIGTIERQLEHLAKDYPIYKRLRSIPGVGLLTATALVAFIGDVNRFPTSRHFSSFLGLTPRGYSSGLHRRLGHISKRGDVYLRMLLIHGARSVLSHAKKSKSPDRLRVWAFTLEKKRGHNIAAVALANKLARIIWAVWKRGETYISVNKEV